MLRLQTKTLTVVLLLFLLSTISFLPAISHAQAVSSLIPCGEVDSSGKLKECTFNHLLQLFYNVIDYVVKYLVIPGATISFAVIGWNLMTNATNPGARENAKKSFYKVVMGLVAILAAWLIVKLILGVFLTEELINQLPLENIK